jgi:hypothetical protein
VEGIYSLISIAGFVLLIWGFGEARLQPAAVLPPRRCGTRMRCSH